MPPKKSTQDAPTPQENDPKIFETEDGRLVRIKPIDVLLLMAVQKSVPMPKVPTYEVKIGNRVQHYPLDAEAAKETPGGLELWRKYQEELTEAQTEQGERMLRALVVDGTERPDDLWGDEWGPHTAKWEKRMRLIGMPVPEDPDEYWVAYFASSLSQGDVARLTSAIMRLNNVPEEMISAAEDAFRDTLQGHE